jgi:hypothetical protein
VEFNALTNLAIVCDKYGMSGILLPWAEKWSEPHRESMHSDGFEGWIMITWAFRFWADFQEIFRFVVYNLQLRRDPVMLWKAYGTNLVECLCLPKEFLSKYTIPIAEICTLSSWWSV